MDSTALEPQFPPGGVSPAAEFDPTVLREDAAFATRRRQAVADEARWLHELSNEVSTASVASAVLRRMLERGQIDQALQFTRELDGACSRCAGLVQARYQALS